MPDDVIFGLIEEVLGSRAAAQGLIMDGFPRTVAQAESVDRLLAARGGGVDHVINIVVPEEEIVRRLYGRKRQQGRSDDAPATMHQRLRVYEEQTAPLVRYYEKHGVVRTVDGVGGIDEIAERVQDALNVA